MARSLLDERATGRRGEEERAEIVVEQQHGAGLAVELVWRLFATGLERRPE